MPSPSSNAFVAKIGYPDRWRDYSAITISARQLLPEHPLAAAFSRNYQMAKIGKPVDRNDWGMTPPTVNAYYSPLDERDRSFRPAFSSRRSSTSPPTTRPTTAPSAWSSATRWATASTTRARKFDAEGNLKNWWTPEDRKKFDDRAACVIDQFNTLDVGEGLRHNGKLVVGEALGDIGGLTLALKAYQRSLGGKPGPVIDGFTAEQRFFIAFARVWARIHRPEDLRLRLNTDPHPIARFRAIGTLQNSTEFQKAFSCKPGDPMVRPPEKQCKLW